MGRSRQIAEMPTNQTLIGERPRLHCLGVVNRSCLSDFSVVGSAHLTALFVDWRPAGTLFSAAIPFFAVHWRRRALSLPDQNALSFLPESPSVSNGNDISAVPPETSPGKELVTDTGSMPSTIGRYRILRLLGEGGMGAVYEAEQESPHRIVALKVIRAGYTSVEMLRRFENETEALGRLQHPGIAQIYDAGTADTPFGQQPYLAMELVRGETLFAWCDAHKLNVRQRLELVAKICDAVQHAHQKGLIHRDLKPANILVGEDGQPKILDFGVARLTDSDAQATRQTDVGQLIGTLAYMSPEQVLGDPAEIDTRSDVYALGVILYELLAGKAPYEIGRQIHEAVRAIREEEPTSLGAMNRTYRGDIETIVGKALEKDKTRRYGSAAELAADIRRHLQDEPIVARPPSTTYQIRKFARRNKALVTGVAAVVVVLAVGVVASTWEAVQARRAEKKAQQETAIAQAVNDFLQNDLLGLASDYRRAGQGAQSDPHIRVLQTVLDRAAQQIQDNFDKVPEVEASIRRTIGNSYSNLGLYPQARQQLEAALALSRRTLGNEDAKTLAIMADLGWVAGEQGHYSEAEKLVSEALDEDRRTLGRQNPQTLLAMGRLAGIYTWEGKYPQAEALDRQTLGIQHRVLGPEDSATLQTMGNLALVYMWEGKYLQAEALFQQVIEADRRVLGPENPQTLTWMGDLATVYDEEGKDAQAEPLDRQVLEIERRVLGPEHPDTLMRMGNLAIVYWSEGKYGQAEALMRQTLVLYRRTLGPEHPETVRIMGDLAGIYVDEGRYSAAESPLTQVLEIRRRLLGPDHRSTLLTMGNLAELYADEGKCAQAQALFQKDVQADRRVLGPQHPLTAFVEWQMAIMYQKEGRYSKAVTYGEQAVAGQRHALGAQNPYSVTSEADLAIAYLAQGKLADAEPLAREAFEAEKAQSQFPPDDWPHFYAAAVLGETLTREKKNAAANPLILSGYQGMVARKDRISAEDRWRLTMTYHWVVEMNRGRGRQTMPPGGDKR
jgi:eukaryotic-like serine/threonine-protein kinase